MSIFEFAVGEAGSMFEPASKLESVYLTLASFEWWASFKCGSEYVYDVYLGQKLSETQFHEIMYTGAFKSPRVVRDFVKWEVAE